MPPDWQCLKPIARSVACKTVPRDALLYSFAAKRSDQFEVFENDVLNDGDETIVLKEQILASSEPT